MSKYEFDLSVGIQEVLDADSAAKVESQIESQKKRLEEPIELTLSISDAKKRFKELEKETKKVQKSLNKALSSKDFDGISQYTKQMSNIQKEQQELLSIIGEQTKAITGQSNAVKTVEATEKRRKKTVDNITAATEDTVAVIKEQAEAINQVAKAEAKLKRARKTKTSTTKNAVTTQDAIKASEQVTAAQEKASKTKLRTQAQINAELDKELQKLEEIEAQEKRNDAAREELKSAKTDYARVELGVDKAVYDTDKIDSATQSLRAFNTELDKATRSQFPERYKQLCDIITQSFTGQYSISNGLFKDLNDFIGQNADMRELSRLAEQGIKGVATKDINQLFRSVVNSLKSDTSTVKQLLHSGDVVGAAVGKDLDNQEIELNQEMQRLYNERIAQEGKIAALKREELDLIIQQGQEEAKNAAVKIEETTDALGEQSKAFKSTTSSLDELKEKYFSIIKTVETYLELMLKFNNIEGNTWPKFRKNMINFIKDMPQDVIEMLTMDYGDKFTEGLRNSFKGMSSKDLFNMIKSPSWANTMGALELKLNLAKNVDFDNIKYTDDGSIKLLDSDNPFEHLHPQHGIRLIEELYKTLDAIAKITSNHQEQLTTVVEKTADKSEIVAQNAEQLRDAYDKADEKVHSLRDSLAQATDEQERLEQHAKVYGYTLDMSAQKAGRIQSVLSKTGTQFTVARAQAIPDLLKGGYEVDKYSDEYGISVPVSTSYTPITKTEYEYAQYLSSKIAELNVGWEEGLKILASQNGQLDAARQKVAQLEDELSIAEKQAEIAYERMAYASHGVFGDDNIEADKKRLAQSNAQAEANKLLQEFADSLLNATKTQVKAEQELSKMILGSSGETLAGTKPISFKYAVMSVEDLVMSHDAYGTVNKNYPSELQPRDRDRMASKAQILSMVRNLLPELLVASPTAQNGSPIVSGSGIVVGGNARSAALAEAYATGHADGYKAYIAEHASEFGLNASNMPKNPVLVRVVDSDEGLAALAKQLNESTTAGYSTTEQALINEELIMKVISKLNLDESANLNAEANRDFIQSFMGLLPENQRNEMMTKDGSLSAVGLAKTIQALTGAAYGSRDMLENLEQIDQDLKNISNAFISSAAKAADIRHSIESGMLNDLGVISTLLNGVDLLKTARGKHRSIEEYLNQLSLFGSNYAAEDVAIGKFFEANVRNATQLKNMIDTILDFARNAGDPNQLSFGDFENVTLSEVIRGAFAKYAEQYKKKIDYDKLIGEHLPAEVGSRSDKRVDRTDALETEAQMTPVIEKNTQAKQEQIEAVSDVTKQLEAQADAENKVAEAANKTVEAKEKQGSADKKKKTIPEMSIDALTGGIESEALKKLREASLNETLFIDLKTVFSKDDLESQIRSMIQDIGEWGDLSLGKIDASSNSDDIVKIDLYNDKMKTSITQTWQLVEATEMMDAHLKLVGEHYSHNVKALDQQSQKIAEFKQKVNDQVKSWTNEGHLGKDNLFERINEVFDANGKKVSDLKQEILQFQSSLNSVDAGSNLKQLEQEFANISNKAKEATQSHQTYVNAANKNYFQNDYKYNNGKTYQDQLEQDSMRAYYAQQEAEAQQFNNNIKGIYDQLMSTLKQMGTVDTKMSQVLMQDKGSGLYSTVLSGLQTEKSALIADVRSFEGELQSVLNLPQGTSGLGAIFTDTRVQTALTKDEIQKLDDALKNLDTIQFNFAAKLSQQIQPVIEKVQSLKQMIADGFISQDSDIAKNIFNIDSTIANKNKNYKETGSAAAAQDLMQYTNNVNEYVSALEKAAQAEQKYFAGKQQYTAGTGQTFENVNNTASSTAKSYNDLTEAVRNYTKEYQLGEPYITKFTQSANGISKIEFSTFDKGTGAVRKFNMEMGNVSQKMYATETTVSKSMANIQAAFNQIDKINVLKEKLSASGIDFSGSGASAQVQELFSKYQALSDELAKGDKADQTKITQLTQDCKLAVPEVEKLYKQMMQMNSAIENGSAQALDGINPKGDIYGQLTQSLQKHVAQSSDGTLEFGRFDKATNTLNATLTHTNGTVEHLKASMYGLNGECAVQTTGVGKLTSSWDRFKSSISQTGKQLMTALVGYNVFYKAMSEVRKGIGYVKEIDLALTELKKVTDETEESYRKFLDTAAGAAGEIGSTVSDFTEATANFARLGYTMEESADMAKTAIVYKNVADGLDTVEESTDSIISTMKAFGIESDNTMQIIDIFNEVGNNFAITSAGIGEAMQRSASALYSAGNSIEESTALITAANSVIQNPEQVGTALKTLSLRIRGVKTELEEAGLETEGMAETTSQLQAKLKALTHGKVDIMVNADKFKNTTQVLREMSAAWQDMTDVERAAALELMGGKRQANILSSLISNFETVEDVIETSMNSSGSAMAENAKWMDSVAGKSEQLSNNMQTMWKNTLNSDAIKWFYDLAIGATDLVKNIGLLPPALAAVLVYLKAFKNIGPLSLLKDFGTNAKSYITTVQQVQQMTDSGFNKMTMPNTGGMLNAQVVNAYSTAIAGMSAKQQAAILTTNGLNKAQAAQVLMQNKVKAETIKEILGQEALNAAKVQSTVLTGNEIKAKLIESGISEKSTVTKWLEANATKQLTRDKILAAAASGAFKGATDKEITSLFAFVGATNTASVSVKGLLASLRAAFLSNPVGWIMTIVSIVAMIAPAFEDAFKSAEEKIQDLESKWKELSDKITTASNDFKTLKSSADEVIPRFAELAEGVDQFGNNMKLTDEEYEEFLSLNNQIAEMFPEINNGMDANGNAMLALDLVAGTLEQSLWDLVEAERAVANEEIAKTMPDVLTNIKDTVKAYNDSTSEVEDSKKKLQEAYDIFLKGGTYEFKSSLGPTSNSILQALDTIGVNYNVKQTGTEGGIVGTNTYEVTFDTDVETVKRNYENAIAGLDAEIQNINDKIVSKWKQLNPVVTAWTQTDYTFQGLSDEMKTVTQAMIGNLDFSSSELDTQEKVQNYIKNNILNKIDALTPEAQKKFSELMSLDTTDISAQEYIDKINSIAKEIEDMKVGFTASDILTNTGYQTEIDNIDKLVTKVSNNTGIAVDKLKSLSLKDLDIAANIPQGTIQSWDELLSKIQEVKQSLGTDVTGVKTYSALTEEIEKYNEIFSQTSEIVADNTEVTQEYKDALLELGISSKDLNDCFYENNPLVVKNANALNNLVKDTKKVTAQNIKLAKSQARLQYYEKYKELQELTNGKKVETAATLNQVRAKYEEMMALQKSIAQYSMLEHQLLGATNAYEEFAKAQEIDSANDYETKAEEMVGYLVDAFHTGKLGAESAQAAIKGLVPESVYEDIDTLDGKMQAVYDYFTTDLSKYFYVKFNDDGSMESAEMLIDNVKKFVEDGIGNGVFTGSWEEWDLDSSISTLEDLTKKMGVTKEVAYAFLQAMETYDISWIGGDASTLLDKLIPTTSQITTVKEQIQNAFDQTPIDLTARLNVSAETLKENGHTSYSSVFDSSEFGLYNEDGSSYQILATPVLPNGDILSSDKMTDYINQQLASGKSIEEVDIFVGSYKIKEEAEEAKKILDESVKHYQNLVKNYSLENAITTNTQKRADLEYKLGTGQIKADTVVSADGETTAKEQLEQLNKEAEANAQTARDNIVAWSEASEEYEKASDTVSKLNKEIDTAKDGVTETGRSVEDAKSELEKAETTMWDTYDALVKIGEPTEVVIQVAKEALEKDIKDAEDKLRKTFDGIVINKKTYKLEDFIIFDQSTQEYKVNYELVPDGYSTAELEGYVGLLNEQYTIDALQGEGITTTLDVLTEIKDILSKTYELMVKTDGAQRKVEDFASVWHNIRDKAVTLTQNVVKSVTEFFTRTPKASDVNGTAHSQGTAFAGGSWGAPKTETALVGELGPELV